MEWIYDFGFGFGFGLGVSVIIISTICIYDGIIYCMGQK